MTQKVDTAQDETCWVREDAAGTNCVSEKMMLELKRQVRFIQSFDLFLFVVCLFILLGRGR